MTAKPISYRYSIAFPRVWDGPRPSWPANVIDAFTALPGVVDASFPELTAAWEEDGEPRSESRRRQIWVTTSHAKQAASDAARDQLVALARDLAASAGVAADDLSIERWPIEVIA